MLEPSPRVLVVQGHVGAAGLEDPEQPHEHRIRAIGAQSDRRSGSDAGAAQAVGELVGLGVELAVGQRAVIVDGRGPSGRLRRMEREQLVHARSRAREPMWR